MEGNFSLVWNCQSTLSTLNDGIVHLGLYTPTVLVLPWSPPFYHGKFSVGGN
jgi:hypothetical protein